MASINADAVALHFENILVASVRNILTFPPKIKGVFVLNTRFNYCPLIDLLSTETWLRDVATSFSFSQLSSWSPLTHFLLQGFETGSL
ncbi:MAG TPA: hypothetical protein VE783_07165 [Candidatus Limnocylindrales bacterium]|jgi:hypothetical protein|nr:hypothetical protein [Candidatus Limnocylindrales bacterium]